MVSAKALRRMYMALWVLGTMPLFSIPAGLLFGEGASVVWAFALLSLLLLWILPPKGKKKRGLWLLLCMAALALAYFCLPEMKGKPAGFLLPVLYFCFLLFAATYKGFEQSPAGFRLSALTAFLILFLVSRLPSMPDVITAAEKTLQGAFPLFLAVLFLVLNQETLRGNGLYGAVPHSVGRPNLVLSVLFAGLIFLTGAWARLAKWLGMLWDALKSLLARISFGGGDTVVPEEAPAPFEMPSEYMLMGEERAPSPFLKALEAFLLKIAPYVFAVLLAIALFFLIRRFVLWVRRWTRARMEALEGAEIGDYVDEIEDVREKRERTGSRRRSRRGGSAVTDPRARIRMRYRGFIVRQRAWDPGMTARETLSDADAAELYERARYSPHPVTDAEAERFAQALDGKKKRTPQAYGAR